MGEYCDLLIVEHDGYKYLVEAPPSVAVAGSLVLTEERIIGRVTDKAFCNRESDAYRFFKQLFPICTAEKNLWTFVVRRNRKIPGAWDK